MTETDKTVTEQPAEPAVESPPARTGKHFKAAWQANPPRVMVQLKREFSIDQWAEIEELYQKQADQGRYQWRFDLCELTIVPSRLLGLMIGLNAILGLNGGMLEVSIRTDSDVAKAFRMARVDRILSILEK